MKSKRHVIKEDSDETYTVFNDVMQAGKFYKLSGICNPDGNGIFENMYGSTTGVLLDVYQPTDEEIKSFYEGLRQLVNAGFMQHYYNNGKAILYIAGDFKNSNFQFSNKHSAIKSLFCSKQYGNKDDSNYLEQISQGEFKNAQQNSLKIINKEQSLLLAVKNIYQRANEFQHAKINPKM